MYNAHMEAPLKPDNEYTHMDREKSNICLLTLLALCAVFVWRIALSACAPLIPDECSYWTWSRRIDWSYFDNSGMVAYLIRLSTELLQSHSYLSVRFPFLIISAGSTYLIYRIYIILFQKTGPALLCALIFNITPAALLGGSAAMHDNALIFFWLAAIWSISVFIRDRQDHWLYFTGLFTGLAILSKYTGVLLLPGLFLFFVLSGNYRKYLFIGKTWIAVGIALIFTLPIMVWNIQHDWASLGHILFIGSGSVSIARQISDGFGYHLAQFLIVSPLFYFAMLYAPLKTLVKRARQLSDSEILLYSLSLPIPFFGLMAFKGHVEANWAFMAYPGAAALAIHLIFDGREEGGSNDFPWFSPRYLRYGALLSVVPVLIVILHAWVGLLPASLERQLGKADRIIWETRGWEGLGEHVAQVKGERDVIAGDKYQMCAVLEYYTPGNPFVRYLAPWRRPTQFDVWEPSFDNLAGRDILFVTSRKLQRTSDERTTIYENFRAVRELPPYMVIYHGEPIRKIHLYRGVSFNPFHPRRLGPRSLFYKE